jgi:hypothetical protein
MSMEMHIMTNPVNKSVNNEIETLIKFYEERLEAGRMREETLMKTIESLLKNVGKD